MHVLAGVQGDAAARSTMLPHVASMMPLSARTLHRHCRMTQVVHDDVADASEAECGACDASPGDSDAGAAEDNLEGTGRIRVWLKKKLKDAMGVVGHALQATPSHAGGGSSAPVATTPTAQVSNEGVQTLGANEVTPEQSDVQHSPAGVPSASSRLAAAVSGPSRATNRDAVGHSSMPEAHMHTASPGRAHVTFSEGASPSSPPKSPYAATHGAARPAADPASPSSPRGAAAATATASGAPGREQSQGRSGKCERGRRHMHGAPLPMVTGLDTNSKALCSFVAQGYQVRSMCCWCRVSWLVLWRATVHRHISRPLDLLHVRAVLTG